jgi:hypothetical protein
LVAQIRDRNIDGAVGQRDVLDLALQELDVLHAGATLVLAAWAFVGGDSFDEDASPDLVCVVAIDREKDDVLVDPLKLWQRPKSDAAL